jgi:lysophospholipid acyltransferase (LPLAT)-like uncharacterized protein
MATWAVATLVSATLRWSFEDQSGFYAENGQRRAIFAIWHNRLALSLLLYRRYVQSRFPRRRMACLVSASRDGGFLAEIIRRFGNVPVRGSSSRRGAAALRELLARAGEGDDIAITPDGPRGPRYEVQDGVVAAAHLTGLPILPVSYSLQWKRTLRSWDRFQVPMPFSRVVVRVGAPLWVPEGATAEEREVIRRRLEAQLREITCD